MSPRSSNGLRVTLVAACPFPCARGGAARVLGEALALRRLGVEAEVVSYDLAEGEPPPGLPVHRIPRVSTPRASRPGPSLEKLGLLDPLLLARTAQVARLLRPHLLHGHHVEGALVALAAGRRRGQPVVFDAHTSLAAELPSYAPPAAAALLARAGGALDGWLVRRADRVVAVTEALRAELLARAGAAVGPERVSVIPMGLERERLRPEPAPSEGAPGPPTAVYAGGLSRFQRLDLLARAFESVRRELPAARLRILSPDPPAALEAVWPGAGPACGVELLHPRDLGDLDALLDAAQVAASPRSAGGGFPQKVLNYMARGLPVVACAGSAAALRHGETGWVVPDGDAEAFAAALLELLRDPALRRRLGDAARREAERHLWDAVGERLLEVYRALVPRA
jgi:glycosyltransferase involved in cell wall biosynthesis